MVRDPSQIIPLVIAGLGLVIIFAMPDRRPERPDPRRRRAWNRSKTAPRPRWRLW